MKKLILLAIGIFLIGNVIALTQTQNVTVRVLPEVDFNVISPVEGIIYDHNRIEFRINSTYNIQEIEYLDFSDDVPRFKKICWKDCSDFTRFVVLREGKHDILFRGIDDKGRIA